jgi:hypothetical protein
MWHACMLRVLEGGQERGREGMCPTMKVDLQCVDFRVEGKPVAETTDGRGGDGACISEEERRGRIRCMRKRADDAVTRL